MIIGFCVLLTLQVVQHELLFVHENLLLEKENSGCRALLRDDKVSLPLPTLMGTKSIIRSFFDNDK